MVLFSIIECLLLLAPALTVSQALPSNVASLLDFAVDPCNNFYHFSCGTWLATHEIAAEQSRVEYSFDMAQEAVDATIVRAVANDSTSLVGALYASCMNMDTRNAIGATPLKDGVERIVHAQDKYELFRIAGRLARTGADFITNFSPDSSLQNRSHNILWVTHADLTLEDEYYTQPRVLEHVEKDLSRYAATVLNLTGFHLNTSEYSNYGDVVLNVEKQLIELQSYTQLDPVSTSIFYLFKYKEAAENYPFVFGAYADGMQLLHDASALTEETEVALLSIAYFEKAEELVSLVSLDALKVYIAFNYINGFARYLSEPYVHAHFEFFREVMLGAKAQRPLENVCATIVTKFLPVHTGALYVAHRDDMTETEDAFIAMLDEILDAAITSIKTLKWLDETTRASALMKLNTLDVMYFQPDAVQLEKEAQGLAKLDLAAFFANVNRIHAAQHASLTQAIGTSLDRSEWAMSAASVNAYYTPYRNQIVFPAGMIQQPFFHPSIAAAQMFGSLGVVVGHEISHGFDSWGSNFDANGNWNNWWTNSTAAELQLRARCLILQYSTFYIEAEDSVQVVPVNGKKTVRENIADNGGLHIAYHAYKSHMVSTISSDTNSYESIDERLFFVSYAQTWCGKVRNQTAVDSFLTNAHAVGEARVNGVAMNSAAFAKAFNCPTGAPMNPVKKCMLW